MAFFKTCPHCGAALDPGEKCDCQDDPEDKQRRKTMGIKSWNDMRNLDIAKYVKKRDGADYLPWADCMKLLYDNGAEEVRFEALVNEAGSSLFMCEPTFTDKNKYTNRCYEVRIKVVIDGKTYFMNYPVMNGIAPVRDSLMNQNAVHKSQMRAFVKCVAINTGLGFDLWRDDSDIEEADDLSKHKLFAIKERMQIAYTNAIKKGMSTKDIAAALNKTEDEVRIIFTYFDQLSRFEQGLNAL